METPERTLNIKYFLFLNLTVKSAQIAGVQKAFLQLCSVVGVFLQVRAPAQIHLTEQFVIGGFLDEVVHVSLY